MQLLHYRIVTNLPTSTSGNVPHISAHKSTVESHTRVVVDRVCVSSLGLPKHFRYLGLPKHFRYLGLPKHFRYLGLPKHFRYLGLPKHFLLGLPKHFRFLDHRHLCWTADIVGAASRWLGVSYRLRRFGEHTCFDAVAEDGGEAELLEVAGPCKHALNVGMKCMHAGVVHTTSTHMGFTSWLHACLHKWLHACLHARLHTWLYTCLSTHMPTHMSTHTSLETCIDMCIDMLRHIHEHVLGHGYRHVLDMCLHMCIDMCLD